jgi:type III secretion protein Q
MDRSEAAMESGPPVDAVRTGLGAAIRYEPPVIGASLVDLANRLSAHRTPLAFTLGDAAVSFKPVGLGSISRTVQPRDRVIFWLLLDGRPLVLKMAKSLYERLISRVDPELLAADIDRDLVPLLLESCLEDAFEAAEQAMQSRIDLQAIELGASFNMHGLDIALEISIDGEKAGRASLRASRNDAELIAAVFARLPRPGRPLGHLAAEVSFRAGTVWLDLSELRALKVGDVIMAERPVARWSRIAAVVGERWVLPVEITRAGATLCQPMREADPRDVDEWMMVEQKQENDRREGANGLPPEIGKNDQGQAPAQQASPAAAPQEPSIEDQPMAPCGPAEATFDELPIKLVFELGRTAMPLGQLQDIGPGYVFQLDRPLGEAVEIHAGGRRIGQGEVVRIDDQVGVRVLRLFGQSQA